MDQNLIVGIQDMGAAGLTCSTTEMASNSGSGIMIDLDLVPQREEGMTPYEIMLSESQERMLIVAKKEKVGGVQKVFSKWDLDAVIIGHVTDNGRLIVNAGGKRVVDIPVDPVVNLCPTYSRPSAAPAYLQPKSRIDSLPSIPENYNDVFEQLLSSPTISDKEWVFRQYDHMVQTNTALLPGADASVLRIKNSNRALAVALDGNSLYAYLDPKTGGKIAVAEACRNLACVGASPIGVTNCLNFGNPEKPEIMWQFQNVIEGISEACRAFGIPVTGGNVSFYNDTEGVSIYPTPVLGVVGRLDEMTKTKSPSFKGEGAIICLLGENSDELGATEYLKCVHKQERGQPPRIDLTTEKKVHNLCISAIQQDLVSSAHDVSEGGLATCLAECSFLSDMKIGFTVDLQDDIRSDALLFGEGQSRIIVSVREDKLAALHELADKHGLPLTVLGESSGERMIIQHRGKELLNMPVLHAYNIWKQNIPDAFRIK
jgi:phosphoribosylformylglycinamidine synthase